MVFCCGTSWRNQGQATAELTKDEQDMIQQMNIKSQFKEDEVTRFYLAFKTQAKNNRLLEDGFKRLMALMGIRISQGTERRIFKTIERFSSIPPLRRSNLQDLEEHGYQEASGPGIDFPAMVAYFDNLLNGDKEDDYSNRFIFNLINQDPSKDKEINDMQLMSPKASERSEKKEYITGRDLENFLIEIESSEINKDERQKLEVAEEIRYLAISIFKDMGLDYDYMLGYAEFAEILDDQPEIKDIFREFGSSITNLLDVQGQNKYTKIVKILGEIKDKFNNTVLQSKEIKDFVPGGGSQLSIKIYGAANQRINSPKDPSSPMSVRRKTTVGASLTSPTKQPAFDSHQSISLFSKHYGYRPSLTFKDAFVAESQVTVRLADPIEKSNNENISDSFNFRRPAALTQFENMDTFRPKMFPNLRTAAKNQSKPQENLRLPFLASRANNGASEVDVDVAENIQQDKNDDVKSGEENYRDTWNTIKADYGSSLGFLAKLSKQAHERAVAVECRFC